MLVAIIVIVEEDGADEAIIGIVEEDRTNGIFVGMLPMVLGATCTCENWPTWLLTKVCC